MGNEYSSSRIAPSRVGRLGASTRREETTSFSMALAKAEGIAGIADIVPTSLTSSRLPIMSSVEMIHPTCCSNEWMHVLKLAKSHNKPNPCTNEMIDRTWDHARSSRRATTP